MLTISAICYAEIDLIDDFDGYSLGNFNLSSKWGNIAPKTDVGGNISIADVDSSQVLKLSTTYSSTTGFVDPFIASPYISSGGKFSIWMRVKRVDAARGSFSIYLRDSNSNTTNGNMLLFKIDSGKINYLPNFDSTYISESYTNNSWIYLGATIDVETGVVCTYANGVLKATRNYKTSLYNSNYHFDYFSLRIYQSANSIYDSTTTYVDDVIFRDGFDPIGAVDAGLQKLSGSTYKNISSAKAGDLKASLKLYNNGGSAKNSQLVFARYEDGALANISLSPPTSIPAKGKATLTANMLTSDITRKTDLKIFALNNFNNITPFSNINLFEYNHDRIYLNESFEAGKFRYLSLTPKASTISLEYDSTKKSNYMLINRTIEDPFVDFMISEQKRYMIFEAELKSITRGVSTRVFAFKAPNSSGLLTSYTNLLIDTSGRLETQDGTVITTMSTSAWYKVAMAVDFEAKSYDIYLDGTLVLENQALVDQKMGDITLCRIYVENGNGTVKLGVDNFKIYEAMQPLSSTELAEIEAEGKLSVFPSDEDVKDALSGTVSANISSGIMYCNNEKVSPSVKPYVSDGLIYFPVEETAKGFGYTYSYNSSQGKAYIGSGIILTIGSNGAVVKDGNVFLPANTLAGLIEKKYYYDSDDFVVLSGTTFKGANNSTLNNEASNFLKYHRPSAFEIQQAFNQNSALQHPRIMLTPEIVQRMKTDISNNVPIMTEGLNKVLADCVTYMAAEPVQYIIEDDLRLLAQSRKAVDRIQNLSFAYLMTGNTAYAERAWEELYAAGNFPDWNHNKHYLDTAEMMSAFAIGYDWLYGYLTEDRRKFVREAILDYGVNPSLNMYYGGGGSSFWTTTTNNWNIVCNGGTIMGALAIADEYPNEAFDAIEKAVRSIEYILPSFAPDGGWVEGPVYWDYAMHYCLKAFSSLGSALGSDFSLADSEGFSKTAEYVLHNDGLVASNNYSDAEYSALIGGSQIPWFAQRFNNIDYAIARLNIMDTHNWTPTFNDMIFYDANAENKTVSLPLDKYFRNIELFSMRSSWTDTNKIFASIHAGSNNVSHSHIDSGAFVLDALGERWAVDLGPDDYNLDGYLSGTFKYYRQRAEAHNVVVINPDSSPGQLIEPFSPLESYVSKTNGAYAIYNLTPAYANNVSSYKRGIMFTDNRLSVTIRDEIDLLPKADSSDSEVYWFMGTKAAVSISANMITLTQNGKQLRLQFSTNSSNITATVMDQTRLNTDTLPGEATNSGYKKIALKITGTGAIKITVRLAPVENLSSLGSFKTTALANWTIAD